MAVTFLTNSINDWSGAGIWGTVAGRFDAAYVDGYVYIDSPGSSSKPLSVGHNVDLTGESIVSFHFDWWAGRTLSTAADGEWGRWNTSAGVLRVYLDISNGLISIRVYNAAGGFVSTGFTYAAPQNAFTTIDIVYEDNGTNCIASLYENEILQLQATVASSGAASMPTTMMFTHNDFGISASDDFGYSQVIFTHGETTLGMKMERLPPNAIGFHQDMSATITEMDDDDRGTGWSSATATDKNSYTLPTYTVPVGRLIHSLNAQSVVRIGTTGPVNIRPFVRISSTDYDSAADFTPPSHQFGKHNASWTVDPSTTVAWTAAGVTATEVGFQVKT